MYHAARIILTCLSLACMIVYGCTAANQSIAADVPATQPAGDGPQTDTKVQQSGQANIAAPISVNTYLPITALMLAIGVNVLTTLKEMWDRWLDYRTAALRSNGHAAHKECQP